MDDRIVSALVQSTSASASPRSTGVLRGPMVWWRSGQESARSAAVRSLVVDPPWGWAVRAERIEAIHTAGARNGEEADAPADAGRDDASPEWGVASLTRRSHDVA